MLLSSILLMFLAGMKFSTWSALAVTKLNYLFYILKDFTPGQEFQFVVDVDPSSFEAAEVVKVLDSAKTIFVNAVMGLMPAFWHGTSKMDESIDRNRTAQKFFGGGDTLQEFKRSVPGNPRLQLLDAPV